MRYKKNASAPIQIRREETDNLNILKKAFLSTKNPSILITELNESSLSSNEVTKSLPTSLCSGQKIIQKWNQAIRCEKLDHISISKNYHEAEQQYYAKHHQNNH